MSDPLAGSELDGVIPSPNIWGDQATYELENLGVDPELRIEAAIASVHDWTGAAVLDIGCGTGFHLPRFAERAATVTGVEPHPGLVASARERLTRSTVDAGRIRVLEASATALPIPDHSVDVAHARWAYFFGPGCEPGLDELDRVMRPGGSAFVIDNDATRSTFGAWFVRALPDYDAAAVERFWARRGWSRMQVDIRWDFATRDVFERVVRIEFAPAIADQIMAEHPGTGVDYAVNIFHKHFR